MKISVWFIFSITVVVFLSSCVDETTSNDTITTLPEVDVDDTLSNEEMTMISVCNALPTTATRLATTLAMVGLKFPENFDQTLIESGSSITFLKEEYYTDKGVLISDSDYVGDKYITYCWKDIGDTHYCIMPMTINIDGIDREGAIKMTFTGQLESLQDDPNAVSPCPPEQDCQLPVNWESISKMATPTYVRTSCEIDIEKDCPENDGYTLCGQCEYSDFWKAEAQIDNLGKCRYCESGTTCSWSVGICGSVQCISPGWTAEPTNQDKYMTVCSGCQTGQTTYYYNGYNYDICNEYYQSCVDNSCTDKQTNCW